MAPAGLTHIDAAKQDGSWVALDAVEALAMLPDLDAAMANYLTAQTYFIQVIPNASFRVDAPVLLEPVPILLLVLLRAFALFLHASALFPCAFALFPCA